jgi:hypothetical protein
MHKIWRPPHDCRQLNILRAIQTRREKDARHLVHRLRRERMIEDTAGNLAGEEGDALQAALTECSTEKDEKDDR